MSGRSSTLTIDKIDNICRGLQSWLNVYQVEYLRFPFKWLTAYQLKFLAHIS